MNLTWQWWYNFWFVSLIISQLSIYNSQYPTLFIILVMNKKFRFWYSTFLSHSWIEVIDRLLSTLIVSIKCVQYKSSLQTQTHFRNCDLLGQFHWIFVSKMKFQWNFVSDRILTQIFRGRISCCTSNSKF